MIILDEPTNHLDIDSRAALAEAINEFPGAVIMVSHDRYLIEACADQLWVVADNAVKTYDGDLDDYRRMVLSSRGMRTSSRDRAGNERGKAATSRSQKREKRVPLKQQISEAETEIARINGIIAQDRYRAGAAGFVQARSEAGRPTQQGARGGGKRLGARRGAMAGRPVRNMTRRPVEAES